jgi:DNA-binding response OmpR family regulator
MPSAWSQVNSPDDGSGFEMEPIMAAASQDRRVLLIEGEPSVGEVLRVLLNKLGCRGEVAVNGQQALAMVSRNDFDAVLLDLRSSSLPPEEVVSGIHDIRPSLVGRVLVITGEVDDHQTLELVERYFLLQIPRSRLINDLVGRLRALLRIAPLPTQI